MNSNFQKSPIQLKQLSEKSPISCFKSGAVSNSNIISRSQFPIIETEEKKVIVRTNIYEPNDDNLGSKPQFCVVTEVIRRSPNISFDLPRNSFNDPKNFSFNQIIPEQPINQSFQIKSINIHLSESKSKNYERGKNSNNYKLLIKRIASQLKKKVHPPTQGFFYFAFQKGEYPINIIRKIKVQIINHSIHLNNNIFSLYNQKYIKYRELIKRMASLLKRTMKNIKFWENQKYSNNNTQINVQNSNNIINVKISENNLNNKNNPKEAPNINNNTNKIPNNKSKNVDKNIYRKNNAQNKNNNNQKNIKINSNGSHNNFKTLIKSNTNSHNNHEKSNPKTNTMKINSYHLNINNNNKMNQKIKPFLSNKDNKMIIKNPSLNKTLVENKEKKKNLGNNNPSFNNHFKIEDNSLNSVEDLNKKIVNVNNNIINEINKENELLKIEGQIAQISEGKKIDIIKHDDINLLKKDNILVQQSIINNNIAEKPNVQDNLDIINTQSEPILYTYEENEKDIEMKNKFEKINSCTIKNNEANINSKLNTNLEINNNKLNINTDFFQDNNNFNMKSIELNNKKEDTNKKKFINMKIITSDNKRLSYDNIPKTNKINENIIDSSLKKERISFNSRKKLGKKIEIKLSVFKKNEEKNNISINNKENIKTKDNIQKVNLSARTNEDNKCEINAYQNNIKENSLHEQISFVNEFYMLLNNNNINIIFNIPFSNDEKGQNLLKQNTFWEKYIQYLYNSYLINNNKISFFSFIQIIEQYFLWCENKSCEINLGFKKKFIDIVNKLYTMEEIFQFLSMNKLNNLDELFKKYEILNKNINMNYKYSKEIEIKLDNNSHKCNCDICKNEIACINRVSEINKNLIVGVNTDNIFLAGSIKQNNKKEKETKQIKNNKTNNIFTKSKTLLSFECSYNYIPKPKTELIENIKKSQSLKKINSQDKSSNKSGDKNKSKKNEKHDDLSLENNKIDDYLEIIKLSDEEEEEEKKINKKKINKKKEKNSKKISKKEEIKSDSESEEEKLKNKKNRKKSRSKKKIKIEISDSENDDNSSDSEKNKKSKIQYPKKKNRKKKGKK